MQTLSDLKERALAYLDEQALVQLTQDLVRLRTINPPGDEAIAAEFVAQRLQQCNMFADVVPHEETGRASVVGGLRGSGAVTWTPCQPVTTGNGIFYLPTSPTAKYGAWARPT